MSAKILLTSVFALSLAACAGAKSDGSAARSTASLAGVPAQPSDFAAAQTERLLKLADAQARSIYTSLQGINPESLLAVAAQDLEVSCEDKKGEIHTIQCSANGNLQDEFWGVIVDFGVDEHSGDRDWSLLVDNVRVTSI
jgi:hypothetical protein